MKPETNEIFREKWREYVDSFDLDSIPEHQFSPEFEKNMEKLIRKQRRKENRPPVLRMARKVAVILAVCCAVSFSGLMTVEAFREQVLHFFTKTFVTHTEVEISAEGYDTDDDMYVLELSYLPEGLEETKTMQADMVLTTAYENGAYFLNVTQHKLSEDANWNMAFDTEDAETEFVEINGSRVWVIRKNGTIQMAWPIENAYITLCGNLPWEEMEKIAEGAYLSDEVYVPSESSQSQEAPPESIPDFPVSTQYREEFAAYLNNVVRFFREPVSSPDSIPRDSSLAGFLLAETYRRGTRDGKSYPQDENQMYQIPNEEISATVEKLLGIEDFDPADIPEWPGSREPGTEYQLYAGEESLPYSEIVSSTTHWEDDYVTVRAVISTAMDEEWLPDPDYAIDRFYTFQRIPDENGEYARLVSVQYAEEEPR